MSNAPSPHDSSPSFVYRHASEEEYRDFLLERGRNTDGTMQLYLSLRERFVRTYPSLEEWSGISLAEQIGVVYNPTENGSVWKRPGRMVDKVSYQARTYLYFLVLHGYFRFDLEWIAAVRRLCIWSYLEQAGLDQGVWRLTEEAMELGYARESTRRGFEWAISRIFLHTSKTDVGAIDEADVDGLLEAVLDFGERDDLELFYGSYESYLATLRNHVRPRLHTLKVILYHRGQIPTPPRKGGGKPKERPKLRPRMDEVAESYVAARRQLVRPRTAEESELSLRQFIGWVSENHPEIESFAQVDRSTVLEFAEALTEMTVASTGQPLAARTRHGKLSCLSVFFRDTANWEWEDVPGRPLLGFGDFPKEVKRVPRYIPEDELARLMEAIRAIECPHQRTALLVARWSGARRDEVRRLEIDCLDSYPDGTPRLRIPAGKTNQERVVPLNEEAAREIRSLKEISRPGRGLPDPITGEITRYLFTKYGKLLSTMYLFDAPLQRVCEALGLLPVEGKTAVTAHRFRHTVGTQLAERGAKLRTIMRMLGHASPEMSMTYAQISDEEVRKEYDAVLGPGATIAGPIAETLRSGELPATDVEWLKTNFFKTELELGHCLRLPQEGPCQCELYLSCAKFVTTRTYAPRLRARRELEFELIEDASSRGWEREVERHRCTVERLEQLLAELGEPVNEQQVE